MYCAPKFNYLLPYIATLAKKTATLQPIPVRKLQALHNACFLYLYQQSEQGWANT